MLDGFRETGGLRLCAVDAVNDTIFLNLAVGSWSCMKLSLLMNWSKLMLVCKSVSNLTKRSLWTYAAYRQIDQRIHRRHRTPFGRRVAGDVSEAFELKQRL